MAPPATRAARVGERNAPARGAQLGFMAYLARPKGSMWLYSMCLGPKEVIWGPLSAQSISYIATWTLWERYTGIMASQAEKNMEIEMSTTSFRVVGLGIMERQTGPKIHNGQNWVYSLDFAG